MALDPQIAFLKTRTEPIGTALFYNFSNALLKFPVSLIQLSKFDQEGNIWFEIKKPFKKISGMDKRFPARLNFYKKGCSCCITFDGMAAIAAEEIPGMITIKFKISSAECFYKNQATSFLAALRNSVSNFIKSFYRDDPKYLRLIV